MILPETAFYLAARLKMSGRRQTKAERWKLNPELIIVDIGHS